MIMEPNPEPGADMKQYVRSMHAKGKDGDKKRYYKPGYRKRKKRQSDIDVGVQVVFEARSAEIGKERLYVGKVKSKDSDTYEIQSIANETRICVVTDNHRDGPVPAESLRPEEAVKGILF